MVHLYRALTTALLSAGKIAEAEDALREVEAGCASDEEREQLEDVRASVLMNQGRFKEAARCLSDRRFLWSTPGGVANNLAVCLEHLGELKRARDLQLTALKEAELSGLLFVEIISLNNIGSMESKLGNLNAADKHFNSALAKLQKLRERAGDGTRKFGAVYADIAIHLIQKGDYGKAAESLKELEWLGPFPIEELAIALARCSLSLRLGRKDEASAVLEASKAVPVFGSFFEIERQLLRARIEEPSILACGQLDEARRVCQRMETRHQECRVLIQLARLLDGIGRAQEANAAARSAWIISRRYGYKPLEVDALMLMGWTAKRDSERSFGLRRSLSLAVELGLLPLVSECAFRLGRWRFQSGDFNEGRDCLFKSVSITAKIAEDLSSTDRKTYLAISRHVEARTLLTEASEKARLFPNPAQIDLFGKERVLFARLYRLAATMTAADDLTSAASTLLQALKQSLNLLAVVVVGTGPKTAFHTLQTDLTEETKKQVLKVASVSGDRPYFTGVGPDRVRATAVWVPMLSLTVQGGIYVECPRGQPALDEQEIEFLTVAATIAGAAFDRVCSKSGVSISAVSALEGIIGTSAGIKEVCDQIELAAKNTATVLIEGESGTGKELVAKAIHARSSRARGPFIPLDCGALPEGLIETELFGAKKGAYTGALSDRPGLFEAADQGTIFLDEISNLGQAAQSKLLRVLQDREVRRIGSTAGRVVDVRLIAATNCNLERMVREGKFRSDLLYRLKVLYIPLPPLRDRKGDIPLLAATFLERLNAANQTKKYFGPGVMEKFLQNNYPGNVRELQNIVERGFYSTRGAIITHVDFLQESVERPGPEETEAWFRDLTEGRQNFWLAVHDRYKRRDISREKVVALVDFGLRATHGSYKTMASKFQIAKDEYRRFMDFLRRNRCLLDFRPYRRLGSTE
jgi:DNA-binding NtrC family response regulator/tetratricopeptide (TPR) repeat protein